MVVYVPWQRGEYLTKNEDNVIKVLKTIHVLEKNFKKRSGHDNARNLFLKELYDNATANDRGHLNIIGDEYQGDDLYRHGYIFRLYLPDDEGHGVTYKKRKMVSQGKAINHMACYSWPVRFGRSGRRTFLLLADGNILETENQKRKYEGNRCIPKPGAGFDALDPERIVDESSVSDTRKRGRGADGQIWTRVALDD